MHDKMLLVWEGGTGKTIASIEWLRAGRDDNALVVCPKIIVKKWKETLKDWGVNATVLSKEDFKKSKQKQWSALVIDEADNFASPLFIKGRSQLATALYEQVKAYPDTPIILLTATPIRSTPWNLHTLLCYLDKYIDWKQWRERFFKLENRAFMNTMAWFPRDNWRTEIRKELELHADIVLLRDCIDEVPRINEEVVVLSEKKYIPPEDLETTKLISDQHRFEQHNKAKEVKRIAKNYRKILVVAYFVEQIQALEKELKKERTTFAVYGGTQNKESILKEANEVDDCYLIVQASLCAGFDADTFSCAIFASMSYSVRDFVQMKYRMRRIHNLHPVKYYYLLAGKWDKNIYEAVKRGRDFVPSEYVTKTS